jgi:hypothetical protein
MAVAVRVVRMEMVLLWTVVAGEVARALLTTLVVAVPILVVVDLADSLALPLLAAQEL